MCVPLMQASANGPRQLWYDLHCKNDGPAAYDVFFFSIAREKYPSSTIDLGKYLVEKMMLY
jgi:hypothetical protein